MLLKKISVGAEPARNPVPALLSSSVQMPAGCDEPPSLDFQTNQGLPLAGSMKGLGSMAPPRADWHSSGPLELSVKAASVGLMPAAVATDRQSNPVSLAWPAWAAS